MSLKSSRALWKQGQRAAVVAALTAGLAVGVAGPATSDQITGEGSLSDVANVTSTAISDATALPEILVGLNGSNGCGGGFTRPALANSSSSSTGVAVFANLYLRCTGWNNVDITFQIQRSRWYGWQSLASTNIDSVAYNYSRNATVSTSCRAGTWSYRSDVYGRINSSEVDNHSKALRVTCADRSNLNYVDLT